MSSAHEHERANRESGPVGPWGTGGAGTTGYRHTGTCTGTHSHPWSRGGRWAARPKQRRPPLESILWPARRSVLEQFHLLPLLTAHDRRDNLHPHNSR
jgi:hypothetical protein